MISTVNMKEAVKAAERFFGFIEDEPDTLSAGKKIYNNDYNLRREYQINHQNTQG